MSSQYSLYLERIDPERNMRRFYALSLDYSLFGEPLLVRRWGRIGSFGQEKVELFASEVEAVERLLTLLRLKRRRRYSPPVVERLDRGGGDISVA